MIVLNVCIPTTGCSRAEHAMSLVNFAITFMREPVFPYEDQSLLLRHYQSSSIQNGREWLVAKSLAEGASHILFVDEDIVFDAHVPFSLLRRRLPLVAGNYKIRYEGMPFAALTPDLAGRIPTTETSPPLEECGACGFGMALIERQVFEKLPQPWFPTLWDEQAKAYSTEDLPFFLNARAAGFTPVIDHEASRAIIHIGHYRYRWNDPRDRLVSSPVLESTA